MKIRKGFVSNSSSSSFVAWGVDEDKIAENINADASDIEGEGLFEKSGSNYDFLGIELSTLMRTNPGIKLSEIKSFVAKKMNKQYGTSFKKEDIEFYEEGWYDG